MLGHAEPWYAMLRLLASLSCNEASAGCVDVVAERHAGDSRHLDFEEQEYWEGSGEELDMHGDDEEADMRTQEELMMQHRYMMVSPCGTSAHTSLSLTCLVSILSKSRQPVLAYNHCRGSRFFLGSPSNPSPLHPFSKPLLQG